MVSPHKKFREMFSYKFFAKNYLFVLLAFTFFTVFLISGLSIFGYRLANRELGIILVSFLEVDSKIHVLSYASKRTEFFLSFCPPENVSI